MGVKYPSDVAFKRDNVAKSKLSNGAFCGVNVQFKGGFGDVVQGPGSCNGSNGVSEGVKDGSNCVSEGPDIPDWSDSSGVPERFKSKAVSERVQVPTKPVSKSVEAHSGPVSDAVQTSDSGLSNEAPKGPIAKGVPKSLKFHRDSVQEVVEVFQSRPSSPGSKAVEVPKSNSSGPEAVVEVANSSHSGSTGKIDEVSKSRLAIVPWRKLCEMNDYEPLDFERPDFGESFNIDIPTEFGKAKDVSPFRLAGTDFNPNTNAHDWLSFKKFEVPDRTIVHYVRDQGPVVKTPLDNEYNIPKFNTPGANQITRVVESPKPKPIPSCFATNLMENPNWIENTKWIENLRSNKTSIQDSTPSGIPGSTSDSSRGTSTPLASLELNLPSPTSRTVDHFKNSPPSPISTAAQISKFDRSRTAIIELAKSASPRVNGCSETFPPSILEDLRDRLPSPPASEVVEDPESKVPSQVPTAAETAKSKSISPVSNSDEIPETGPEKLAPQRDESPNWGLWMPAPKKGLWRTKTILEAGPNSQDDDLRECNHDGSL